MHPISLANLHQPRFCPCVFSNSTTSRWPAWDAWEEGFNARTAEAECKGLGLCGGLPGTWLIGPKNWESNGKETGKLMEPGSIL